MFLSLCDGWVGAGERGVTIAHFFTITDDTVTHTRAREHIDINIY